MIYIVYKTTNKINGKTYIGIHKQQNETFDGYYGSGVLLKYAILKYGIDNFIRETLFVYDNLEDAKRKEKQIVTKELCYLVDNYNISVGGTGENTLAGYDEDKKNLIYKKRNDTNILRGNYEYSGKKLEDAQSRMIDCRIQPDNNNRKHEGVAYLNMKKAFEERTDKYVWITNGEKTVLALKSDNLPDNWRFGRGEDVKKFVSHTNESKIKISNKIKGDICYNNGLINLKLKVGEMPPKDFIRGMIQKHNSRWITNGYQSKKLSKEHSIPEGWIAGRNTQKGNNK